MKRCIVVISVFLIYTSAASYAQTDGQPGISFEEALGQLYAEGYPQELVKYFCSLGTNPELGFRWAGTTAEHAAGMRILEEMNKMSLSRVRREPVPVDVFEFKRAAVTVGSREMIASTYSGVQSTSSEGITAAVVYVRQGTAADFAAAGDVSGKIVLIDQPGGFSDSTISAFEADYRQAIGAIYISYSDAYREIWTASGLDLEDQVLAANAGLYDLSALPFVCISKRDGDWIKSQIGEGEVKANIILDQKVTLAKNGGVGYNVLGELPGSSHDGQQIVMLAHQDAHFRGASDNTSGLVNLLTIAKAMLASNYRPQHTIIFMATTGEECGRGDTPFDGFVGAWWAANRDHKEWAGRTRAVINVELGGHKAPLNAFASVEFKPWLQQLGIRHYQYVGNLRIFGNWPMGDHWSFAASGIPSIGFGNTTEKYAEMGMHTNLDTADKLDWEKLEKTANFLKIVVDGMDDGLLPFDLREKATAIARWVKQDLFIKSGADESIASRLIKTFASFEEKCREFHGHSSSLSPEKFPVVNQRLLEIERVLHEGLFAYQPDRRRGIFPHQEVLQNAIGIKAALTALNGDNPDISVALESLGKLSYTRLGTEYSYPVFRKVLERHHPGNNNLFFAEAGKVSVPLDVIPEYRAIEKGNLTEAISGLEAKYRLEVIQLNRRLREVTFVLEDALNLLDGLLELCGQTLQ